MTETDTTLFHCLQLKARGEVKPMPGRNKYL